MKITPIEIKEHRFKKGLMGYDKNEVNALMGIIAETIEELAKQNNKLEEKIKDMATKLFEHEEREKILRETITTAQKMVEDLKKNATQKAERNISKNKPPFLRGCVIMSLRGSTATEAICNLLKNKRLPRSLRSLAMTKRGL